MKSEYKPGLKRDVDKDLVNSLNDTGKIKLTIDGYDLVSSDWDKTRQNFWPELIDEIKKYIPKRDSSLNTKILDLGCGNGRLIDEIEKLNNLDYKLEYFGIDPSKELIKIAIEKHKEKLSHENINYKLESFDGLSLNNILDKENINLEDERFDQVISIAVLHHIPPSKVVDWLKEANRVTKKDTVSIFTTWNLNESNYDLNENKDAVIGFVHHKNTRYVHYYDYAEIRNIFNLSGYSILEIKEIKRESGMSNTVIIAQK